MSKSKKIMLKSSDGEVFEHMIEDDCAVDRIPLPNVTIKIFYKAIKYCNKHDEASMFDDLATTSIDDDLKAWDADLVKVD
ncbi:hypothetical protein AB3S75_037286 [Citrus x aurantiifolia]